MREDSGTKFGLVDLSSDINPLVEASSARVVLSWVWLT